MKFNFIDEIEIKKLFGRYNYKIIIPPVKNEESSISLLYGDNGTGKTTILKLLFHLLSPAKRQGHKTYIAGVPFNLFSVRFTNKTKILVKRTQQLSNIGPYSIEIFKPGRDPIITKVQVNDDNVAKMSLQNKEYLKVLNELESYELTIFFLGDDRFMQSDEFAYDPEEHFHNGSIFDEERRRMVPRSIDVRDMTLQQSLKQTVSWFRQQLIREASRGDAEAQDIFATIVERINKLGIQPTQNYEAEKEALIKALKQFEKRSRLFTKFGLFFKVDVRELIKQVKNSKSNELPYIAQVVRSFMDGQKIRLDALEKLNNLLNRFVKLINGFFYDKEIELQIHKGISIFSDSGNILRPESLSSGEKQLLLLLLNVLTARDQASLFIIDEPELSLNIKWQRRLIDALLDITQGCKCQFFLATHSIELLTKHNNQTIKLNPIPQ